MLILAFETSCDDTAVAVVKDGTQVLSAVTVAQVQHSEWGGVVPEIAARLHAENWRGALDKCLEEAQCTIDQIDALAVTQGPGLQTSLLNGTTAASFLSLLHQKPLIPVHHIAGHIHSIFLERKVSDIVFPALVLVASGGHTDLYLWKSVSHLVRIGKTLDDAVGEAFDKTAKMLGLGYPGGPIVSKMANKGDGKAFDLPRIWMGKESLDFSFSGLKAAVYRTIQQHRRDVIHRVSPSKEKDFTPNICASFQHAVADTFLQKFKRACHRYPQIKQIHFVGGVSANTFLQEKFQKFCTQNGLEFLTPVHPKYSTDNAAMIGAAAYFAAQEDPGWAKIQFVNAQPRLSMVS